MTDLTREGLVEGWQPPEGYRMVLNPLYGRYAEGFDRDQEYRFLRYGETDPQTFRMCDVNPYFNIAGLYFATTGATDER